MNSEDCPGIGMEPEELQELYLRRYEHIYAAAMAAGDLSSATAACRAAAKLLNLQ
jgi:hypothetical protein